MLTLPFSGSGVMFVILISSWKYQIINKILYCHACFEIQSLLGRR